MQLRPIRDTVLSMHLFRVAGAAWVFASTPSKVPFYVAGAVLVCWAFGVAVTGIARPGFVRSERAAPFVVLTSAALAAAAIATAVTTAGPPTERHGAATATPSNTLQLAASPTGDLAYDRTSATVRAGRLTIRFVNASPIPHNVTIARGTRVLAATDTLHGGRATATATLSAGDYVFYCSVDAHRQAGMHGTLTVR